MLNKQYKSILPYTGIPHHTALCLIVLLCSYCIFHKLRVCGNPDSSKYIGAIFRQQWLTSGFCIMFWVTVMIFVLVICDLCCYYHDSQTTVSIFSDEVDFNEGTYIAFSDVTLLVHTFNRLQ